MCSSFRLVKLTAPRITHWHKDKGLIKSLSNKHGSPRPLREINIGIAVCYVFVSMVKGDEGDQDTVCAETIKPLFIKLSTQPVSLKCLDGSLCLKSRRCQTWWRKPGPVTSPNPPCHWFECSPTCEVRTGGAGGSSVLEWQYSRYLKVSQPPGFALCHHRWCPFLPIGRVVSCL